VIKRGEVRKRLIWEMGNSNPLERFRSEIKFAAANSRARKKNPIFCILLDQVK
jgi:hypothetical protein